MITYVFEFTPESNLDSHKTTKGAFREDFFPFQSDRFFESNGLTSSIKDSTDERLFVEGH